MNSIVDILSQFSVIAYSPRVGNKSSGSFNHSLLRLGSIPGYIGLIIPFITICVCAIDPGDIVNAIFDRDPPYPVDDIGHNELASSLFWSSPFCILLSSLRMRLIS